MIKLIDILTEGVYDPGIFKAVFTAGGPGSGKSYVASTLFGMPEKMPFVSAKGLKSVNSDKYFETTECIFVGKPSNLINKYKPNDR